MTLKVIESHDLNAYLSQNLSVLLIGGVRIRGFHLEKQKLTLKINGKPTLKVTSRFLLESYSRCDLNPFKNIVPGKMKECSHTF